MPEREPAQLPRLAGDPKSWRVVVLADPDAVPPQSLYEALLGEPGIPVSLRQDLKPADDQQQARQPRQGHIAIAHPGHPPTPGDPPAAPPADDIAIPPFLWATREMIERPATRPGAYRARIRRIYVDGNYFFVVNPDSDPPKDDPKPPPGLSRLAWWLRNWLRWPPR